jgi:hypothetical protein
VLLELAEEGEGWVWSIRPEPAQVPEVDLKPGGAVSSQAWEESAVVPRRMDELPGVPLFQVTGASVASAPSALLGEEPPDAEKALVDPVLDGTDQVGIQPKDFLLKHKDGVSTVSYVDSKCRN